MTEEYVAVANDLARRAGLGELVAYRQGSALALPWAPGSFDGAYLLHVGMNIEDKAGLFAEIRRVLAPSGVLGIYDVMRAGAGELAYPVPWATLAGTSFVADPPTYRRLLEAAGFEVLAERDRREFALEVFRQMRARGAGGRPAALGLHIVMGPDAGRKVDNMMGDIERGLLAPVEMFCRAA